MIALLPALLALHQGDAAHQVLDQGDDFFLRSAAESSPAMQVSAMQAMTGRLLGGEAASKFAFEILKSAPGDAVGKTLFELAPPAGKQHPSTGNLISRVISERLLVAAAGSVALIRGSTGVELAAGLGHYLRHVANVSFSWPGTGGTSFGGSQQLELPALTKTSPEVKRFVRSGIATQIDGFCIQNAGICTKIVDLCSEMAEHVERLHVFLQLCLVVVRQVAIGDRLQVQNSAHPTAT